MYGLYQIMYFTIIDIINTLISPFFIAIFLVIYYQYYTLSKSNHNLSVSKSSPLLKAINSSIFGILGGFISTIAFIYLEVTIVPKDFMYILTVAIVLSLINPRLMCVAYGGSIICLISYLTGYPAINPIDIMLIVATLHIVESVLILINGFKGKSPAYFELNGDFVGGYNINRYWPIPFVIFVGDGLIKPMTLMAILVYGDYTISYPAKKTILTSFFMFIYSTIMLILIKTTNNVLIAPLYALVGHEIIVQLNIILEKKRIPVFTNSTRGVRIIEVSKKGIARELGISAGDLIISINDIVVKDTKDIVEIEGLKNKALRISYFSKKKGFVTKTYKGNKKALGISIVPRVVNY